jgi:hypothetical protein
MLKSSYSLEEIKEAIKKEHPEYSEDVIHSKAEILYKEIMSLDAQEKRNNKRYWKRVQFSGDDTELDFYLQSKGICAGIDGQKTKLVTTKNIPVASRAD